MDRYKIKWKQYNLMLEIQIIPKMFRRNTFWKETDETTGVVCTYSIHTYFDSTFFYVDNHYPHRTNVHHTISSCHPFVWIQPVDICLSWSYYFWEEHNGNHMVILKCSNISCLFHNCPCLMNIDWRIIVVETKMNSHRDTPY
jgi:hypothetical protein